jgi:EmrB/QacA subfamily drug resistance transporter
VRTPCDEAVIRSARAESPCPAKTKIWILVATILGSSMAFIDGTVVNVALPAIQTNFHATIVQVQWVLESYGLFSSALILVGGSLGDLLGRRLIFTVGISLFAVASAVCGGAMNIQQLVMARSIQGMGAALLVPGSLAIISVAFDEKSRGRAIGTWSAFTAITTAIGPVLGGWLVEHGSWRYVFLINLPLAAIAIAISLMHIPESRAADAGRIDWTGALFATVGLGGLITGFMESVNLGWGNPLVFGSLILGVVCLFALVVVEGNINSPMLPLTLFESRSFTGANLLTLFLYAATGIFFFLFPLNLIQVQGYSTTAAGAALLPFILLMFLLSRWSGGLVVSYGPKIPLIAGPIVVSVGFALFAVPSVGQSYWTTFFPAIVVLGFGMAVTVAPLTTVVVDSVSEDRVGSASGINNAVARVAGVFAIAIFGIAMVKIFSSQLDRSLAHLSISSAALEHLHAEEIELAALQVPPGLSPSAGAAIMDSVKESFVFGFRIVMLACAGLSLASAAVAWLTIRKNPEL